jgi:hypothetical protein
VTVESLAVWLTISPGLAVAKEVSFAADGKEIARTTLESRRGQQKVPLAKPATFRELTMTVHATFPGQQAWGSISEIEGFDASGKNVLLSPPRNEPRAQPADTLKKYQAIKQSDPTRPVFMTLTGNFHPHFNKYTEAQRGALYPGYVGATDIVGYDIYPIYGWNKPEWLYLVHDATKLLVAQAGNRPVYAWIETSKGGSGPGRWNARRMSRPPTSAPRSGCRFAAGRPRSAISPTSGSPPITSSASPTKTARPCARSTTRSRAWPRRSLAMPRGEP